MTNKVQEELCQLRKNDSALADVLQIVEQIKRVYSDIKEAQDLTDKFAGPVISNLATGTIVFRSDSSQFRFYFRSMSARSF